MINQMAERMCGASLSMLIDRLLDQIEKLSGVIVPAQADRLSCEDTQIEARLDQLAAA
jgi:hypothetical protein